MIPPLEDPPPTIHVIAPIPLFAIGLSSVAHDLTTATLGTLDFYNSHILSCFIKFTIQVSLAWPTVLVHHRLIDP